MSLVEIQKKVSPIFGKYGLKHAAVFGSVARGSDTKKSDVDILIRPGRAMGLIAFSRLIRETEETLNRKVDMVTEKSVNKFLRPHIVGDLKTIYEG